MKSFILIKTNLGLTETAEISISQHALPMALERECKC